MADNKQLPATGTGTANIVVGTDEITGVDYQQIKLVDGTLGSTNAAIVDTNGALKVLPVDVDGVAVTVFLEDLAATDTDPGTPILGVRNDADATRTSANGDYGWLSLDDTGRVKTLNAGTQVLGTDTYTEATSKGLTVGAVRRDADTTLVNTTNEFGPLQMDANGRLKVEAFSGETLPTSLATLPALVAGSANIGDVDVLTVPADPFGVNADAASGTGSISAKLRLQAAAALVGDAAATATPTGIMEVGLAKAAAPTDVSADNDAVAAWRLRNGAAATVLTAAGALVGGDATNGLDVDVTRVTGTVTVDSELAAAVALTSDAVASPTVPQVAGFGFGYNGTTWDRVRTANTGRLQVDVVSDPIGGAVKQEDSASSGGEYLMPTAGVRNDSDATKTDTDGDFGMIALDRTGRQKVRLSASTGTLSNVAGSATSVTVLAANVQRVGATIWNDSTAICYVKFGATASTTSCTVKLIADAYYEVPFGYTGIIDGIWASATGNARVTELT